MVGILHAIRITETGYSLPFAYKIQTCTLKVMQASSEDIDRFHRLRSLYKIFFLHITWAAPGENVYSGIYANSKCPDQHAHPRNLTRTFAARFQNHWHYENTTFILLKISPPKTESFQIKILTFLHSSARNIDYRYSLEPPHRGCSNEYLQPMFLSRNKKKKCISL